MSSLVCQIYRWIKLTLKTGWKTFGRGVNPKRQFKFDPRRRQTCFFSLTKKILKIFKNLLKINKNILNERGRVLRERKIVKWPQKSYINCENCKKIKLKSIIECEGWGKLLENVWIRWCWRITRCFPQ